MRPMSSFIPLSHLTTQVGTVHWSQDQRISVTTSDVIYVLVSLSRSLQAPQRSREGVGLDSQICIISPFDARPLADAKGGMPCPLIRDPPSPYHQHSFSPYQTHPPAPQWLHHHKKRLCPYAWQHDSHPGPSVCLWSSEPVK